MREFSLSEDERFDVYRAIRYETPQLDNLLPAVNLKPISVIYLLDNCLGSGVKQLDNNIVKNLVSFQRFLRDEAAIKSEFIHDIAMEAYMLLEVSDRDALKQRVYESMVVEQQGYQLVVNYEHNLIRINLYVDAVRIVINISVQDMLDEFDNFLLRQTAKYAICNSDGVKPRVVYRHDVPENEQMVVIFNENKQKSRFTGVDFDVRLFLRQRGVIDAFNMPMVSAYAKESHMDVEESGLDTALNSLKSNGCEICFPTMTYENFAIMRVPNGGVRTYTTVVDV